MLSSIQVEEDLLATDTVVTVSNKDINKIFQEIDDVVNAVKHELYAVITSSVNKTLSNILDDVTEEKMELAASSVNNVTVETCQNTILQTPNIQDNKNDTKNLNSKQKKTRLKSPKSRYNSTNVKHKYYTRSQVQSDADDEVIFQNYYISYSNSKCIKYDDNNFEIPTENGQENVEQVSSSSIFNETHTENHLQLQETNTKSGNKSAKKQSRKTRGSSPRQEPLNCQSKKRKLNDDPSELQQMLSIAAEYKLFRKHFGNPLEKRKSHDEFVVILDVKKPCTPYKQPACKPLYQGAKRNRHLQFDDRKPLVCLINTNTETKNNIVTDDCIELNDNCLTRELNTEYMKMMYVNDFFNSPNRIIVFQDSNSSVSDKVNTPKDVSAENMETMLNSQQKESVLNNSRSPNHKIKSKDDQRHKDITTDFPPKTEVDVSQKSQGSINDSDQVSKTCEMFKSLRLNSQNTNLPNNLYNLGTSSVPNESLSSNHLTAGVSSPTVKRISNENLKRKTVSTCSDGYNTNRTESSNAVGIWLPIAKRVNNEYLKKNDASSTDPRNCQNVIGAGNDKSNHEASENFRKLKSTLQIQKTAMSVTAASINSCVSVNSSVGKPDVKSTNKKPLKTSLGYGQVIENCGNAIKSRNVLEITNESSIASKTLGDVTAKNTSKCTDSRNVKETLSCKETSVTEQISKSFAERENSASSSNLAILKDCYVKIIDIFGKEAPSENTKYKNIVNNSIGGLSNEVIILDSSPSRSNSEDDIIICSADNETKNEDFTNNEMSDKNPVNRDSGTADLALVDDNDSIITISDTSDDYTRRNSIDEVTVYSSDTESIIESNKYISENKHLENNGNVISVMPYSLDDSAISTDNLIFDLTTDDDWIFSDIANREPSRTTHINEDEEQNVPSVQNNWSVNVNNLSNETATFADGFFRCLNTFGTKSSAEESTTDTNVSKNVVEEIVGSILNNLISNVGNKVISSNRSCVVNDSNNTNSSGDNIQNLLANLAEIDQHPKDLNTNQNVENNSDHIVSTKNTTTILGKSPVFEIHLIKSPTVNINTLQVSFKEPSFDPTSNTFTVSEPHATENATSVDIIPEKEATPYSSEQLELSRMSSDIWIRYGSMKQSEVRSNSYDPCIGIQYNYSSVNKTNTANNKNCTITSGEYNANNFSASNKSGKDGDRSQEQIEGINALNSVVHHQPLPSISTETVTETADPQVVNKPTSSTSFNTILSEPTVVNSETATSSKKGPSDKSNSNSSKSGVKRPASDADNKNKSNKRYKPSERSRSSHKSDPFTSSFSTKTKYGMDSRWALYNFTKPEDCFEAVRTQWCCSYLPNPHDDLTCRFYKDLPSHKTNFEIPGDKTARIVECLSIYDDQISVVTQEMNTLKHDLDAYGSMWERRKINRILDRIDKLRGIQSHLAKARDEAYHFYYYYRDPNTGWSAWCVTDYKRNEVAHHANMIDNYESFYGKS